MIKSKGYFLTRYSDASSSFQLLDFNLNLPSNKQVLIEIEAFGLNYADVMARKGLYQEAPPIPCILGYEVVGKILKVGSEVEEKWVGKRVVGFCRFGGYATHVLTEIDAVCEINNITSDHALALATQYVTAYYMVEHAANIQEGERVLIHAAAGGVGTALIQLCKLKKAHIIAKVSNDQKEKLTLELGANQTINYTKQAYNQALDTKIDVSFNPIGGKTFKTDLSLLDANGRLVLFGGSELSNKWGVFSKLNFVRKMGMIIPIGLMMQSKSVLGVNMLRIADKKPLILARCLRAVVQLAEEGKITPIIGGTYKHTSLAEAHELLESGKSVGKINVHWNEN